MLFPEYRPSEKTAITHVQWARKLGLVPLFIALVLMLAQRTTPGPGLWSAFGLTLGIEFILWGTYAICIERNLGSRSAIYLALTADSWFPLVLFAIQNAFILLAAAVLWFTMEELGFPTSAWLRTCVVLLVVMVPVCRLTSEGVRRTRSTKWEIAGEICRYVTISLGAAWLASTITAFMSPGKSPLPPDLFPIAVILWVMTSLVILVCILILIDHVMRLGRDR